MGIKGLAKLLSDEAPDCIREVELKSLHGRKIAIDASMAIYQFLIAVRSGGPNQQSFQLTNDQGETTSHIQGLFNRTVRYMTEGIKPVFVFDGKPPNLKSGELQKRREKRVKAQDALKVASEEGNVEELDKQTKRLVRAGEKENHDCQKLLNLMGIPIVLAPCEAEAQAAHLAKTGQVYATATEDMDALTFATPTLIRKMTFASSSGNGAKALIQSMDYEKALSGLGLTQSQFVDLCILLGCDYCDTIRGVGPKTALKLIREHGSIEIILAKIDRKKFGIPDDWLVGEEEKKVGATTAVAAAAKPKAADTTDDEEATPPKDEDHHNDDDDMGPRIPSFVQARKLFLEHEVLDNVELKWKPCQSEPLTRFLVDEMGFNAERVQTSLAKLEKAYKANKKPQSRMDNFFKIKPAAPKTTTSSGKRKSDSKAASGSKKKGSGKKR